MTSFDVVAFAPGNQHRLSFGDLDCLIQGCFPFNSTGICSTGSK